ncbi:MAG: PQQ-dependent sugar dehydrogenase [Gemmatimonadales bacterium]
MSLLSRLTAIVIITLAPVTAAAQGPAYRVEELAGGLRAPWSLAFLPDSSLLIVEKHGTIRRYRGARLDSLPVGGGPTHVLQRSDGGLLDIVLDPAFATNRQVYLSFVEGTVESNRTALFRARWNGAGLEEGQVIFRATPAKRGLAHPGGRLAWLPDGTLLLSIGDGYDYRDAALALGSDLGKLVRLTREGRPASDNPFVTTPGARPEIYSYGHRNQQGLLVDPRNGEVWAHEHGPKGGDEINRIRPGANYGWPRTTFGIDYDNTVISPIAEAPGIERPVVIWVPSIAPSGFALYLGTRFPAWDRRLLHWRVGRETSPAGPDPPRAAGRGRTAPRRAWPPDS